MAVLRLAKLQLQRRLHHLVLHREPDTTLTAERLSALARALGRLSWLEVHGRSSEPPEAEAALLSTFKAERLSLALPAGPADELRELAASLMRRSRRSLVVALGLDGLMATQDRLHGPGSWDRLWATYDRLRELPGLVLEIRTRALPENVDELLALVEFVRDQAADGHGLCLPPPGLADDALARRLRVVEAGVFDVLDRYPGLPQDPLGKLARQIQRVKWETGLATLEQGRQVVPCMAGLAHAVVRANGDVSSCETLPPVGNLVAQDWARIWSGAALDSQRSYIRAGGCHCADDCALHDSVVLRPANLPRLLAGARG